MKLRILIPTIAGTLLIGSAASAANFNVNSSVSHPALATASFDTVADFQRDRRNDRRDRRAQQRRQGSAETYGRGRVETSRRNSRATVESGGRASGPGRNSAGSTVEAYGETNRDGSYADIYGDSTADNEPNRNRRDD